MRTQLAPATQTAFRDVDLIATPSTGAAGTLEPTPHEWLFTHRSYTTPFNATDNPALSVQNGFDADGMPLSLQRAGNLFDHATCFRAGDAYERAAGWNARRPSLEERTAAAA